MQPGETSPLLTAGSLINVIPSAAFFQVLIDANPFQCLRELGPHAEKRSLPSFLFCGGETAVQRD